MQIYEALKQDHRKFEDLLDRLVVASEAKDENWKNILEQLSEELIPHAHAEEAVFYNAIREASDGESKVLHSYVEHGKADMEIRALKGADAVNANWPALAKKLRDDLRHHIEEEETKIFAEARRFFNAEEADQMGIAFEKLKPAYAKDADSMVASTMDLVANMLPPKFARSLRKGPSGYHPSA